MCSEGVSVWFACKLCKSFFLNGDDFAYHKKKSHVEEFQNTKFIVFEEQTTPPASPPENWVSFLSPKEETRIHKIISSPLPSPSTTTNADCNPNNENIESNRNKECIKIDPGRNSDVNDLHTKSDVAGEEPNNCVKLNSNFISNDDAIFDDQDYGKIQSNVASTTTDSALTDEKRDNLCSSRIKATLKRKTNGLKRSTRKIQNLTDNKALLQSVIQSRNNPCVYLERLNLITIPHVPSPSPSNSTIPILSQENDQSDTNHNNADAKSSKQPKVKCENQENSNQTRSEFTSPPRVAVKNCKFCFEHFNSTSELDAHEEICPPKRQFENTICVPSLSTIGSSDELNAHNQAFHSTSISTTPTLATTKGYQPQLADEHGVGVKVDFRNEIQSDFQPAYCNKSNGNEFSLSLNQGDHVYNNHFNRDFDLNAVSNADNNDTLIPHLTTEVNLNIGSVYELVKTEYVTPGIEDGEFPVEDRDPFESVLQMESSAELSLNVAASSSSNSELNQTDTSRYCISCQKMFISIGELKAHNRSYHETQYGNRKFKCPHPNCEKSTKSQYFLKVHVMQVHSDARPYNCPHPNCTVSFKTTHNRGIHLRRVHRKISSYQVHNRFESTSERPSNHFDTNLAPQTDWVRYCISCKKSFTSIQEIRIHNKIYHMTQEGRLRFSCPYSNCAVTTEAQYKLKNHIIQVHSNVRPFKCPHPTCKMSFKTASSRNRHAKCHTITEGAPHNTHIDVVEPLAVAVVDLCT